MEKQNSIQHDKYFKADACETSSDNLENKSEY